jgi:hypothetical protein
MFVSAKKYKKCDEGYIMKNIIWTLHKYFWDDEIKTADMGRACSTYEDMITEYEILFGKAEGRKLL